MRRRRVHCRPQDSRVSVIPSSLSLRCSADRSIPMKLAVREILPENRRIWTRRYSRSNVSRASRSGAPMIAALPLPRSEEHTSELQSLMRISYAVFCLKKKRTKTTIYHHVESNEVLVQITRLTEDTHAELHYIT